MDRLARPEVPAVSQHQKVPSAHRAFAEALRECYWRQPPELNSTRPPHRSNTKVVAKFVVKRHRVVAIVLKALIVDSATAGNATVIMVRHRLDPLFKRSISRAHIVQPSDRLGTSADRGNIVRTSDHIGDEIDRAANVAIEAEDSASLTR